MPMETYEVCCLRPGCGRAAVYKIAARWSDGVVHELKTYALCCETCLAAEFAASRAKQATCRLVAGETLEVPGIYDLARGRRSDDLTRRADLESTMRNEEP